jgi:Zn-dependent M28 family amino/carboxypeptidase
MNKRTITLLILSLCTTIILSSVVILITRSKNKESFDEQQALTYVKHQVGLGARILGSAAHEAAANWIISTLLNQNWHVDVQEKTISGVSIKNIVAKKGTGTPWIIIGSHYDSRLYADRDLKRENWKLPVLGANDGASSVAILLELANVLQTNPDKQIWLVFFDAEDNGNIPGYSSSLGSQYFVSELNGKPDSVVILDMVGDKDLNIYMEQNSDPIINQEIWDVASALGYTQFIPSYKHAILDDHTPFIIAGIRAVDIIDFDYPFWHTTQDTLDKVSAESLKAVGDVILKWLEEYPK